MTLRRLALAAALALACAPAALAQTASSLSVKDSTGTTQTLAGQVDALSRFHYRDVLEGLTSGGAPDPVLTDGAGHPLFSLYGALPLPAGAATATGLSAIVTALGAPLQAGGNVAVSASALPAGAATAANQTASNTSLTTIATNTTGSATAAGQATGNTNTGAIATASGTPADAAYTGSNTATLISLLKANLTASQAILAGPLNLGGSVNFAGSLPDTSTNALAAIATNTTGSATAAGSPTDALYTSGSGSMIAILKAQLAAELAGSTALAQTTANAALAAIQAAEASNIVHPAYTAAVAASATYTGATRDATAAVSTGVAVSYFNAIFYADQAATAYIDLSDDGSTWTPAVAGQALTASTPLTLTAPILARYYRVRLVNGATAETTLRVSSSFARN